MSLDTGFVGKVKSLAGVEGYGLESSHLTTAVTTMMQALDSNPKRKYAVIQVSPSSANPVQLYLGEYPGGGGQEIALGGHYQIDPLNPWTGAVTLTSAGAYTINVLEVSVRT